MTRFVARFLGLAALVGSLSACGPGPDLPLVILPQDGETDGAPPPGSIVPLALGTTAKGTNSSLGTYVYRVDLAQTDPYALVLENVSLNVTATVYADAERKTRLGTCTAQFFSQGCLMNLSTGAVYIEIAADVFGSSYSVTLVRVANEGTAAAPVALSAGSITDLHTVVAILGMGVGFTVGGTVSILSVPRDARGADRAQFHDRAGPRWVGAMTALVVSAVFLMEGIFAERKCSPFVLK